MLNRVFVFAFIPVMLFGLGVALLVDHDQRQPPPCFEDEVAIWDGEGHNLCVPIDLLFENPYDDGALQPALLGTAPQEGLTSR